MEAYSALRVFWKSRQWKSKKLTPELDEDNLGQFRRNTRLFSDIEELDEQKLYGQEVTLPCSMCGKEVGLGDVFAHKKQHVALAILGFQWMGGKKPQPFMIAVQRQLVISKLLASSLFTEKILQSINNAFELLWRKLVPAYYKIFNPTDNSSTCSPNISHLLIKGVATCGDRNPTWKADMNDAFTIMNDFGNKPNACFFGLFDGHHGASAANLASTELPILLLHQLSKIDPSYQITPEQQQLITSFRTVFREEYTAMEDFFSSKYKTKPPRREYEEVHKAFAKAFWRMDRLLRLGRGEVSRVGWSGCSAVACLLTGTIKYPHANDWGRASTGDAESHPSQIMPPIVSGVLHVANVGDVQAVLCRNGKGFCLTKEHTIRNVSERSRVLQSGAVISANEPYGLLEGHTKTTRGLGFHGNLQLRKYIIPAPQTISVPIDDLCQFLILATKGLWDVLNKKEVTALVITMFQIYKEIYASFKKNKPQPKESLLLSISDTSTAKSESDIHILFQYEPESEGRASSTDLKKNSIDSKHSEDGMYEPTNAETFPAETTDQEPCSEKETSQPTSVDGEKRNEEEPCTKSFYESAAKYISQELVNAALEAGSRDNITVTVIFLSGSEYQLLT